MQIINKQKIEPYFPLLKELLVLAAFGFTGLLLFKDLYFYDWAEKKVTILYSIPIVFLFFYWIKYKLDDYFFYDIRILSVDIIAIVLAAIRLLGWLFHSGHVLFLMYTMWTTRSKTYRWICMPIVIVTVYFKAIYWKDFTTPAIGACIALVLIYVRTYLEKRIIQ